MFDKFGEFDSAEELNRAAAAQFKEGDEAAIYAIAEENGIDKEDADDYMDGCTDELATPLMAAVGKLKVESEDLKLKGVLQDWVDELRIMCTEDEDFAEAVRRKGKDLAGYIAKTAETGYENRAVVDKRIVEKAGKIKSIIGNHEFSIGIPDKKTRR
ncbi:MAG: hypothetical protein IJ335_06475 [Lachnospiraceae bacterium]|nr:hypothetical protein [Lachnospiraceae bacterium]